MQPLPLVWGDEEWQRLGAALRLRREVLHLTQQQVADRARVALATVKTFEGGKTHRRYPGNLTSVALALGWTPESPRQILDGAATGAINEAATAPGQRTPEELIEAMDPSEVPRADKDALLQMLTALRAARSEDPSAVRRRA